MAQHSRFRSLTSPVIAAIAIPAVLFSGLLAGCSSSNIRIGWVGNNYPGRMNARFNTFTGTEDQSFQGNSGRTLTLDYEMTVEKGALTLRVTGPGNAVLGENTVNQNTPSASDRLVVELPQTGRYAVSVTGSDAGGSFDIAWTVP